MSGDDDQEERYGGKVVGVERGSVGGADGEAGIGGQSGGETLSEGFGGAGGRGVEKSRSGSAGGGRGGFAAEAEGFVEEEEGGRGEEHEEGEVGGGGGGGRRREGKHRGGGACVVGPVRAFGFWGVLELKRLQQFGIFCFPNYSICQLLK